MPSVSLSAAAKIANRQPEVVRSWRHNRRLTAFRELGRHGGREADLDLRATVGVALFAALGGVNRSLEEVDRSLRAWMPSVERVMVGEAGNTPVFAVEVTRLTGAVERWLAISKEALADAMKDGAGTAATIVVVNLSEVAFRTKIGWGIATVSEDEARADFLAEWADLPEEAKAANLAYFEGIARRLNPTPRPASAAPPTVLPDPSAGRRTSNGTFIIEADPAPAPASTKPKVFP